MKTANAITLNRQNRTIEVTKKFYIASSKYNSEEEILLREAQQNNPGFKVVVATRTTAKNTYKGLTYEYMETYIIAHDDQNKSKMKKFLDLRAISPDALSANAEAYDYAYIKNWFLDEYPEISAFHTRREEMLEASVKKAEKKRLDRKNAERARLLALIA